MYGNSLNSHQSSPCDIAIFKVANPENILKRKFEVITGEFALNVSN